MSESPLRTQAGARKREVGPKAGGPAAAGRPGECRGCQPAARGGRPVRAMRREVTQTFPLSFCLWFACPAAARADEGAPGGLFGEGAAPAALAGGAGAAGGPLPS